MAKKRILIFGDSNTWGWNPINDLFHKFQRWDDDVRWAGVMQKELGDDYVVIPEGLNGRTTVWEDPIDEYRCGKDQLIPCLDMHDPLDLVIIFVGSNDLKQRFSVSPQDIAYGAGVLVDMTLHHKSCFRDEKPCVLLISPAELGPVENTQFKYQFAGGVEKSKLLHIFYKQEAEKYNVAFLDAAAYVKSSQEDGLHWQADQHAIFGKVAAEKVKEIFGETS